ncbi:MAG: pantetheine-phosphate adenylyltransferase [Pseudomonadota bacterium]|nr:pantetheine-phosphate adenylyltransferase [Pseudomonadota bacterium]MDE3037193.1 pantetheine-phosphate adenylyltransferase [Pseudomonadota bacterium]
MRTGIYPGTFDPITVGHMDIIRRALKVVDKLIIAVALDTGKEPIFALEERAELVRAEVAAFGADAGRIEVKTFTGLLVDFAQENSTSLLIRGLRAISDFEYEFQMACMNSRLDPAMETVFLTASENTHFISSRIVKQIARLGGDISSFVSPNVAAHLKAHFAGVH